MSRYINLANRAVISVSGNDKRTFLQGLITNDINKVSESNPIYCALLNPQGRFLYDFFIIEHEDRLLLDCNKEKSAEITRKLGFYKLNAQVEIEETDFLAFSIIEKEKIDQSLISFPDPRNPEMGLRAIAKKEDIEKSGLKEESLNFYNNQRLNLKIADDSDLTYDKSLILEYGFETLNAVDYKKGCYVGQEVTARTHYKGVIRKSLHLVEIANTDKISKESEITCSDKKVGIILSSNFYNQKLHALALIKENPDLENMDLEADNKKIILID